MDEVTRRITYRGDPALLDEMLGMFGDEGVTVTRVPQTPGQAPDVTVLSATGTFERIKGATGKMRHRLGGRGDVSIDGEDA